MQIIWKHFSQAESRHIVVLYQGIYYKVMVYADDNTLLKPYQLQEIFRKILDDSVNTAKKYPSALAHELASLTCQDRTKWAETRESFFGYGINRLSLDIITRAIFFLNFDEAQPQTLSEKAQNLFYGNGCNRWVDKSVSVIIFKNSTVGVNCEHSWGDAPTAAHAWEYAFSGELLMRDQFDTDGYLKKPVEPEKRGSPTQCLQWDLSTTLQKILAESVVTVQKQIDELDLQVDCFNAYSKGFMKKVKLSPDGYVQMALQLAYYRMHKKFVLTYESSMTRLFQHGRTETIRSLSRESTEWVLSMFDPKATNKERYQKLNAAVDYHSNYSKLAMSGKGVDRHLFCLYVVAMGTGKDSKFLSKALSIPWQLSTSQVAPRQTTGRFPKEDLTTNTYLNAAGGFGPVSEDGYGVSYNIANDNIMFFHVSSKRGRSTNSKKFLEEIFNSLAQMKQVLEAKD